MCTGQTVESLRRCSSQNRDDAKSQRLERLQVRQVVGQRRRDRQALPGAGLDLAARCGRRQTAARQSARTGVCGRMCGCEP